MKKSKIQLKKTLGIKAPLLKKILKFKVTSKNSYTLTEVEDCILHKKTGHQFKHKDFPGITISIG